MSDLFPLPSEAAPGRPLADQLRPERIEDVVGQDHLLGPDGPIGRMLSQGRLSSLILWGPPGVGKTTIARLLAGRAGLAFEQLWARCCSSMRSIGSTGPSRTGFCPSSNAASSL